MAPLQEIFERGDKEYVIALLRYYTSLLLRWANTFGKSFLVGSTPSPLYPPSLDLNNSSLFFETKVVNTELHKALPAIATHVDHLCVKALQVLKPILKKLTLDVQQ
jgi:hypothetical protein